MTELKIGYHTGTLTLSFDAIYNETTGSTFYTWPANSAWKTALESTPTNPLAELTALKTAYNAVFEVDSNGNIKEKSGSNATKVQDFVNAAAAYATKNNIQPTKKATGAESGSTTINDVEYGYYFVTTNAGSLITLTTLVPDAVIEEKNDYVPVDKKVTAGEENKGVGDTVNFTITAGPFEPLKATENSTETYKNIVLTDIMTKGLTPNNDIVVEFTSKANQKTTLRLTDDYTVVDFTEITEATEGTVGSKKLVITIPTSEKFNPTGGTITVTYSAVINADAITTNNTNQSNQVELSYGNSSSEDTESEVIIYRPADLEIFKWTELGTSKVETGLANAQFKIYEGESASAKRFVEEKTVETVDGKERTTYKYRPAITDETLPEDSTIEGKSITYKNTDTLISGTDGKISISGLASGSYKLAESKAPDGYNKLTNDLTFTINVASSTDGTTTPKSLADFGTTTIGYSKGNGDQIKVVNTTGAQLPSTGGSGTTMMYIAGGALLIGAVVLMITRKRVSE